VTATPGLVEDLDDLVLVSVVQTAQVQIRTVMDDVGVLDLASWMRVVAVVDEEQPTPGARQDRTKDQKAENRDRGT